MVRRYGREIQGQLDNHRSQGICQELCNKEIQRRLVTGRFIPDNRTLEGRCEGEYILPPRVSIALHMRQHKFLRYFRKRCLHAD